MKPLSLPSAALLVVLVGCAGAPPQNLPSKAPTRSVVPAASALPAPTANVFSQPSPLLDEIPQFDRITDASFRPAFAAGMAEQLRQIAAITESAEPPGFENTIVAMERSGRTLYRVSNTFSNLQGANTDAELDAIDTELAPQLARHWDAIYLDSKLFARVMAVHETGPSLHLDAESAQLLSRTYLAFVHAGASCNDAQKGRLRQINEQLSSLATKFRQNVLLATKSGAVVIDDVAQLAGFSEQQIGAAATAAKTRGLTGKWLIPLVNTTEQPALAQLQDRALRERVYRASIARCNGGATDNTGIVAEIVRLRSERAQLLGYPSYAASVLEDESARTPEAVNQMLAQLAPPAIANAKREAADIRALIELQEKAAHRTPFALEAWDWAFYAEQVKKARFAFDESETKPYFELNHVLFDGVFYAATHSYGLTFRERHDLPVYQADVRTFEVFDHDGAPLGLFLTDYYARENKQGGAWESQYVDQSQLFGTKAVVANHLNVSKPAEGQPTLLTFDEVTTMFHEFGHALHALLSNVKYQSLSGTATPRDFVEYPSQFNEMWAAEPSVLGNYAKDYRTGAPMPAALLAKVLSSRQFNQGFATSEYIAAAIVDQTWHQIPAAKLGQLPRTPAQVVAFEAAALGRANVDFAPVPPRYHTWYFSHAFSGGYAAGYYAYLWSDVLARDTESWMHQRGGLKRENGDILRAKVLSRGRTEEPSVLFENFYGGPPDIRPLLEKRGLVVAASAKPKHPTAKAAR